MVKVPEWVGGPSTTYRVYIQLVFSSKGSVFLTLQNRNTGRSERGPHPTYRSFCMHSRH